MLLLASCADGGGHAAPAPSPGTVVVGSFDFPESEVLAHVYGQALLAKGIPVQLQTGLGPRELVDPALLRGLIRFVPEYQGSALDFLTLGSGATGDQVSTHASLVHALEGTSAAALASAPGEDANAFAVSAATAERYGLHTISDLAPVASKLVLGGPPECPERPLCLVGLRRTYGLRFRSFVPLDAGGPLTIGALANGDVDVALVFTTDPNVAERGFRVLEDDRNLEPAENVTPVVSRNLLARWGDRLTATVDAVSAELTTAELTALDRAVAAGRAPAKVAGEWLAERGFD
ncbi:MAG TPA: ABC transporter substrate-binding protein [Actinomycetota bacterium]|nr:ABC transporter substrate-binding protein [Actinomycetota bacterium]